MASEAPTTSKTEGGEGNGVNNKDKVFDWPPLESSPEVLTEYMHNVGLPAAYQIGELYGFDEDLLAFVPQPVHATVVCMERKHLDRDTDRSRGDASLASKTRYYMKQTGTLDNACGIIACIHATLNSPEVAIQIAPDSVLGRFYTALESSTPMECCQALEVNDEFKRTHKKFASQGQSREINSNQAAVKHHYIAYILHDGKLLEMDGTKQGPHVVAENCTDVLRGTVAEMQRRLALNEITDNLAVMTLNTTPDM
jgi:ubiquitin carboxyl-terminal hydrolase L3